MEVNNLNMKEISIDPQHHDALRNLLDAVSGSNDSPCSDKNFKQMDCNIHSMSMDFENAHSSFNADRSSFNLRSDLSQPKILRSNCLPRAQKSQESLKYTNESFQHSNTEKPIDYTAFRNGAMIRDPNGHVYPHPYQQVVYPGLGVWNMVLPCYNFGKEMTHLKGREYPHINGKRVINMMPRTTSVFRMTESRPFACTEPGCGKAFQRREHLNRHDRIHRKDTTKKRFRSTTKKNLPIKESQDNSDHTFTISPESSSAEKTNPTDNKIQNSTEI